MGKSDTARPASGYYPLTDDGQPAGLGVPGIIYFLILGAGTLLPWNAFLNCSDFWMYTYPDFPFMSVITATFNVPNALSLFVCIWLGPRMSFLSRFVVSFLVHLLVLLLVPIATIFLSSNASLPLILGSTMFAGVATAFLFGAATSLASLADPSCITAFMTGNGVAGIIVAVLRVITKVSFAADSTGYRNSTLVYFSCAVFFMFICVGASFLVVRAPAARRAIDARKMGSCVNTTGEESGDALLTPKKPSPAMLPLFRKLWLEAFNGWGVFFVTLSLYPGVTSLIKGTDSSLGDWFQVILTSFFMVFDFVGRSLPYVKKYLNAKTLWIPIVARLLFFPLFLLPALGVWKSDAAAYILMALFALSNGYLGTLAMEYGPASADEEEKESATLMCSFSQNFGILCASLVSLLLGFVLPSTSDAASSSLTSSLSSL